MITKTKKNLAPGVTRIQALNLEPPYFTKGLNDEVTFHVRYINDGVLGDAVCSKEVFKTIETKKLDMLVDRRFVLEMDNITGAVTKITVLPREAGTVFEEEMPEDAEKKSKSKYLILQKMSTGGNFEAKVIPEALSGEDLADIMRDIAEIDTVKDGDIIAGKFVVSDVRRNGTYIYIDSSPV